MPRHASVAMPVKEDVADCAHAVRWECAHGTLQGPSPAPVLHLTLRLRGTVLPMLLQAKVCI